MRLNYFSGAKKHSNRIPIKGFSVGFLWEYEYQALKLFALSVLWRAHTSTRQEFAKVNLGPHEPIIKDFLLHNPSRCPGRVLRESRQMER